MLKVTVIIPVYNEEKYVAAVWQRLQALAWPEWEKEIIFVDDGSSDHTAEVLKSLSIAGRVITHARNRGKGAAIKTGLAAARGEIIAIQDADLEYDPADLAALIAPIVRGEADVVYGSRMTGHNAIGHWRYYFGNKLISVLASWLYGAKLSDVETGYKVFRRALAAGLELKSDDFGIEAELTAKFLKSQCQIIELPISYRPRRFSEGKKIRGRDGWQAIWLLIKLRFLS